MIKILSVSLIFLAIFNCPKKTPEPDNPPEINNYSPSALVLDKKVGDNVQFSITAIDADDDSISYRTLVDGMKVNDSNTYTFNIPDLGTYTVQMDAYNDEIDSKIWTVNVGNTAPVIGTLSNVNVKEDQIAIGSVAKSFTYSDNEDSLEDLVVELSQTNSSLIKFGLDNDKNIVVEDYTADGNGSSTVTIKVTDTNGAVTEKSFNYNISPMTDIEGEILDSDTWEPNNALQGFVIINGDTTYADSNGKYKTQIIPATSINIEAGYRSLDKTLPMSFITTARNVLAGNDVSNADIMVVTYLNNNLTPAEMRILAWETNFRRVGNMNYTGAKVPSIYMKDYLVWENYTGDVFTQAEMNDVKKTINDSINVHLKYPFAQVDTSYFRPQTEAERTNVIRWSKDTTSNPSIGTLDYNSDGNVDFTIITSRGDRGDHNYFISALLEEGYGARGEFGPVTDPSLAGKTIAYESLSHQPVFLSDIKFIKFIEGVAHKIGYLVPKMPLDDVFKIQE